MRVTVKLFASYKERAGRSDFELPEDATVASATSEVLRLYPKVAGDASKLMVAVNEEYQAHDFRLRDGDEVALIPPVSGGCLLRTPDRRDYDELHNLNW